MFAIQIPNISNIKNPNSKMSGIQILTVKFTDTFPTVDSITCWKKRRGRFTHLKAHSGKTSPGPNTARTNGPQFLAGSNGGAALSARSARLTSGNSQVSVGCINKVI